MKKSTVCEAKENAKNEVPVDGRVKRYRSKGLGSELLLDLQVQIGKVLEEFELSEEIIHAVKTKVVEQMSFHWGGQIIYFPMGADHKSFKRDWAIYNAFTGRNHAELAYKFGVSRQTIYKAISRVRNSYKPEEK